VGVVFFVDGMASRPSRLPGCGVKFNFDFGSVFCLFVVVVTSPHQVLVFFQLFSPLVVLFTNLPC